MCCGVVPSSAVYCYLALCRTKSVASLYATLHVDRPVGGIQMWQVPHILTHLTVTGVHNEHLRPHHFILRAGCELVAQMKRARYDEHQAYLSAQSMMNDKVQRILSTLGRSTYLGRVRIFRIAGAEICDFFSVLCWEVRASLATGH